jgi:hypothetical protein
MPHRPHPGPHQPPHRGRIVAHFAPEVSRDEFGVVLSDLGGLLQRSSVLTVNEVAVPVPDAVQFELVYERTPHGSLALVVRAEWQEQQQEAAASGQLRLAAQGEEA